MCVTSGEGSTFVIHMNITGGTGRFEGAKGQLIGVGIGPPVGGNFLSAETIEITGEIVFE